MLKSLVAFALLLTLGLAASASAAEQRFALLIDSDNNSSTGCRIPTANGPAAGIEQVLTTVVSTTTTAVTVARVELQNCSGVTLGLPSVISNGGWPVGLGLGTFGLSIIETSVPLSYLTLTSGSLRILATGRNATGGQDATAAFLAAVRLPGAMPYNVPLSPAGLALMVVILLYIGLWHLRRTAAIRLVCLLLVLQTGLGTVWAGTAISDGSPGDWTGISPAVTDPRGDAPVNADIAAVFYQGDQRNLYFRIDADLQLEAVANQAPLVNAGQNQTITLPEAAILSGSATDDGLPNPPGALAYTWSLVSGPGAVSFGNAAASSTSATFGAAGTYLLRLTVSDSGLSNFADVTITVNPAGSVGPQLMPISNRTILLGTRLQQLVQATSPNISETLTYSLPLAPSGASLRPAPLIDWIPTAAQLGPNSFTARVTDSQGRTATTSFTVTVAHTNNPPQLLPQAGVILPVGTAFIRTLQAIDPDAGDTLTFALTSGPAGMTLTGAVLSWATGGYAPGDYLVTTRVTDAAGLFDDKQFMVTLMPAAPPPVAVSDNYEVHFGDTLARPAAGVLANDVSYSGRPLSAIRLTNPDKGILNVFNPDGGFNFTAPAALPPGPGLNPVVSWRGVVADNNKFALAADFNHDGVVDHVSSTLGDFRAWRGSDGSPLWQWDRSITTHADISGCGTAYDEFALGDVTDVVGGDIYLFSSINCDQGGFAGFPDRYFAINASQITGGKVATQWKSERLSRPHPGAYATATSADPGPSVTPNFGASANGSVPTLAKLTAGGTTKLLSRFLAASTYGSYYDRPNDGHLAYAACRTVTGLPADEGLACKATFVLDAATGVIEQVLTAPNTADQATTLNNTPTRQNIPIVADLDGDGQVEIISGGDVWKLTGGVWTLAWQAQFDSVTPGLKHGFEPASVAVADLDGDGLAEVIIHMIGYDNGPQKNAGGIHIFNHDGTLRRTIPIVFTWINGLLSVADIDGDGAPEILLAGDSFVYAYRQDGTLLWAKLLDDITSGVVPAIAPIGNTPHTTDSPLYVYDLDLDGVPEVVIQGTRRLFILNGRTGAELWSIDTESDGYYKHGNPLLVDADGDGHIDIVVHLSNRWNCDFWGSGPGGCRGNAMRISGGDHNWSPGPKVQNQLNFRPAASDAAAKILYDASVRRDFRQQGQEGTVTDPRLAQSTSFTYKANDGIADSVPATVLIDIKPRNRPPVITSTPPTALFRVGPDGVKTIYTITAVDPDPGDTVHYELVSSNFDTTYFPAPTVDAVTGNVDLYSCLACGSARVVINVAAVDAQGARAEQSFIIDLSHSAVAVPDVIGQLLAAAKTTIEAASLTPLIVAELFGPQPVGTVIGQDPLAGTPNIPRSATVKLTVSKGPQPFVMPFVVGQQLAPTNALLSGAGLGLNVSSVFSSTIPAGEIMAQVPIAGTELLPATALPVELTVSAGGPLPAAIVSIVLEPGPGPLLRLAGDELQYKAVALLTDGSSADITLTAAWSSTLTGAATIDTMGVAKAVSSGATTISASLSGKTGQGVLNVAPRVSGDTTLPTAAITSPADGEAVTGLAPVIGTASDANFLRYELAIALAGDDHYTLIAQGTTAVTGGTLGTLDPALLVNDLYTLRLTVFDRSENATVATRTVQVNGHGKIGLFSLTFQDLNIPAAGIPLTIHRTYDSRDKTKGDFGIGWRLGMQTLRLRANRVPGTGWVRTVSGPVVSLSPTSEHKVSVTLPDGRVEEFDMTVSPTSNVGSLDFTTMTGFQPRPGTLGQLQALGNSSLLIVNGGAEDELVDDYSLNTYSPALYRYTTADGLQIELSPTAGVQKVTDRDGNTVTFGPGGILHSNGTGIIFDRDSKDRIVAITDLLGNVQTYGYDGNGDLVTYTDPVGAVSRFAYDRNHGLIAVRDTTGNHALRNEYDAEGRLTATIDASGNRAEFTHDLNTRQEIVRDRLGNLTLYEYDSAGSVVAKTDALGGRTTYTSDNRGNELTVTDPLGRVATRTYDTANNVLTSTDFDGNTTTSTYNSWQQVLTTQNPEGLTTVNVYDANGNLMQTTNPEGSVTRYTYNTAGNRLTTTDPLGNVTTFTYDALGYKTSETDPSGTVTTLVNDLNGNLLSSTRDGTQTTQLFYDNAQRLVKTLDALGQQRVTTYSTLGDGRKPASVTDARGQTTRYTYDARGNLIGTTFPDGSAESLSYDAENRLLSKSDRDGRTTAFQYDALGRRTKITHPDGASGISSYDAVGRVVKQTDERGAVTTIAYEPNKRTTTDALGGTTVGEFDSRQRLVKTIDALSRVTGYGYDSAGNPIRVTFPDGSTKKTVYDAAGHKLAETDQAGMTTRFAYDARGRLTSVTDAAGGLSRYSFGPSCCKSLEQTDSNGQVTRLEYDLLERLVKRIRPLGQVETFVYDANGNQVFHTDFNGATTTTAYDAADRPVTTMLPGGAVVNYAYTGTGLRTQAGGDRYVYNNRGRLIQETKASGIALSYTYDAAGNRTTMTTPQGTTTYTYDALNRLATVADSNGMTAYTYDAVGNLTGTAYPNGVATSYHYNSLNRLLQMTNRGPGGLLSSYTYTVGPAGNRLQVVEAGSATTGRTVLYTYDDVYRLTREQINEPGTVNDHLITYSYDPAGNRLQMKRDGVSTNFTYDHNDRLLTEAGSAGTFSSTYDSNGNLKTRGNGTSTDVYTYDGENRLISVQAAAGVVTYRYDADGMRISRTAGGTTTTFLLDKNVKHAQVVVETTDATTATYTYGNQLISQTRTGSETHFYLTDGHLSTRQLTTPAGVVSDAYTYDAFGVLLASAGATPNVYLYAGEQFDPNAGFYYLRARYYNQAAGRFVTTDAAPGSIFEPATLHRYLYANGDPVTHVDPSGNFYAEAVFVVSLIAAVVVLFAAFHPRAELIRDKVQNGARKFLLRICSNALSVKLGLGASVGVAVIAEQGIQRPKAAKYRYEILGVNGGLSLSLSESDLPFETDIPMNAGSFSGHGLMGSAGVGYKALGVSFSSYQLGDGTWVSADPSSNTQVDKSKGASLTTGGIDWTRTVPATTKLLDASGNLMPSACQ